jgi:glycosyltransferase involved in cell wall biosynthesis
MPALPSIGVVTISFNQAKFLPECLRSVTSQLAPDDQYVIVDPGSSDGSRDIIAGFAAQFPQIQTVFEKDKGPPDGLNKGFARLTTDLGAYLNSDDLLFPGALAYARDYMATHPAIDVLIGTIKMIDENGKPHWRGRVCDPIDPRGRLGGTVCYVQQGTFLKMDAFRKTAGFNIENKTNWDAELIWDMAIANFNIKTITRPLGGFRVHPGSLSVQGVANDAHQRRCATDRERMCSKIAAAGFKPYGKPRHYWERFLQYWRRAVLAFRPVPKK